MLTYGNLWSEEFNKTIMIYSFKTHSCQVQVTDKTGTLFIDIE